MKEADRVVISIDDIPSALEALQNGEIVVAHPNLASLLEHKARLEGIEVIIQDDGFCYEIIPKKGDKNG